MNPKKKLPDGAVELARQDEYMLSKGTRYIARGASGKKLDQVKIEFERITGKKLVL